MKLRNVRRQQWQRYTIRLALLNAHLPRRQPNDDPFDQRDALLIGHRGYVRMMYRRAKQDQHAHRQRMRRGGGGVW